MAHGERLIVMKVLMVNDEIATQSASGRAVDALAQALRDRDVLVTESTSADDGQAVVRSDPSLQAILLDWTLSDDDAEHDKAKALIDLIRTHNAHVPIFLMAARGDEPSISAAVMRKVDELIWILEDTTFFIAGRIMAAMRRYREQMAPPFTKALIAFAQVYEYSWHTPGHTGVCSMDTSGKTCCARISRSRWVSWARCSITAGRLGKAKSMRRVSLARTVRTR